MPTTLNLFETEEGLRVIHDAIAAAGGELRVVGGAVRDALRGLASNDIDCATTLPPQAVMDALAKANIKAKPTGIAHGTITAIHNRKGYEITTLRRDVATDGRRATVAFTDDWREDAARRDLTFNALYLDRDGRLYDYFGGKEDLDKRYIRLIGDPAERLKEDALRILRVFRFYAQLHGEGAPAPTIDPASEAACRALCASVKTLSAERLWNELSKQLTAKGVVEACERASDNRLFYNMLGCDCGIEILQPLVKCELDFSLQPSAVLRLAALLEGKGGQADLTRLRLSKAEYHRLQTLRQSSLEATRFAIRQTLYDHKSSLTTEIYALAYARAPTFSPEGVLAVIAAWESPVFPLRGETLLKNGQQAGAAMGLALRETESWWRGQDFAPSTAACLAYALTRTSS